MAYPGRIPQAGGFRLFIMIYLSIPLAGPKGTLNFELDARPLEYPVEVVLTEALPHEQLERGLVQGRGVGVGDALGPGVVVANRHPIACKLRESVICCG